MNFSEKVGIFVRALKNTSDKKHLLSNSLLVLRNEGVRGLKYRILKCSEKNYSDVPKHVNTKVDYPEMNRHILYLQETEYTIDQKKNMIKEFKIRPLISVIMPVYNVPPKWLYKALDSLLAQIYENWELCVVDDCSTDKRLPVILKDYASRDSRIRVELSEKNGGISIASNKSLGMANGEFAALMDNDDVITNDAFFWVVKEINEHPDADFIYSDECVIDDTENGNLKEVVLKPDWSPETLMRFMYTGHLTVYKTELMRKVGGFRSKFDTGQDFDMALRVSEMAACIRHIERVLYSWRAIEGSIAKGGKPKSYNVGAEIADDMLKRRNINGFVVRRLYGYHNRIVLGYSPLVSIIIPSCIYDNTHEIIEGIVQNTAYSNYEVIVVANREVADNVSEEFRFMSNLKVMRFDEPMNHSKMCNIGADASQGDVLIFCRDIITFKQVEWLDSLVELLFANDGIGAVSPKIFRNDETIQYAGMMTGVTDLIGAPFNQNHKLYYDNYWTRHLWVRNISVLSATCMAIKTNVFRRVGGFNQIDTPDKFSNAELSFRIRDIGYRCVYNCHSEIYNGRGDWWDSWERSQGAVNCHAYMLRNWGKYLTKDPYFSDSMKMAICPYYTVHYKIHYNPNSFSTYSFTKENVLLITHELTLTGAPIVVHQAAKLLAESGYFPVIISDKDGPLRQNIVDDGLMLIVDPCIYDSGLFRPFASSFDFVIANTICVYLQVDILNGLDIPVMWWFHEAQISYTTEMLQSMPSTLKKNIHLYCGGEYAKKMLLKNKRYNIEPKVLLYGMEDNSDVDIYCDYQENVFLMVGSLEYRKGQDIFCKAIELMPTEIRDKCQFYIIGRNCNEFVFDAVIKSVAKFPRQLKYIEELQRDQLIDLYKCSLSIVSASRDDPMPLVMTEAMMFGKVCICSENTGTASIIDDGVSGFIFKNNSHEDLLEKMIHVYKNRSGLKELQQRSRGLYEQHFTMERFRENLISEIEAITSADS